jgi:hypothetical protein
MICTHQEFITNMTLGELEFLNIYSQKLYTEVPELQGTTVLIDIKGCDTCIGSSLDLFSQKHIQNTFFCSFNRKILANLPTRFKKGTTLETTFMCSEYQTIVDGMDAVILHWTCLDHRFIAYCKQRCIKVYTYTHKDDEEFGYMCRYMT